MDMGKERIMEVYLNSIEMGEGIYGAEAVAEAHFGKHAYQLTKSEAALIAATLPNPRKFNSAKPSPYMLKRQAKIISLMGKLIKVEMGYGAGQVDPGTGKVKKRRNGELRYHDLGRIAYADALEYQTAAFEVLLDAKATGKKEDNQLSFVSILPA